MSAQPHRHANHQTQGHARMPHEISLAQAADMVQRTTVPLKAVQAYTHLSPRIRKKLKDHEQQAYDIARQINAYERKVRNGY